MNLPLETLISHKDWLTCSGGTNRLQISVLTQTSDCDYYSLAPLDVFLTFHPRLCCIEAFPLLRNYFVLLPHFPLIFLLGQRWILLFMVKLLIFFLY